MMIGILGFILGTSITGLVWYVKDYCFDCLYLKGYKRGYDKGCRCRYREVLEREGLQKESEE